MWAILHLTAFLISVWRVPSDVDLDKSAGFRLALSSQSTGRGRSELIAAFWEDGLPFPPFGNSHDGHSPESRREGRRSSTHFLEEGSLPRWRTPILHPVQAIALPAGKKIIG